MDVAADINDVFSALEIIELFPNPASDQLNISYNLNASTKIRISILDKIGRTIIESKSESKNVGNHISTIDIKHFAKGAYLVQLQTNRSMVTKRFIIN